MRQKIKSFTTSVFVLIMAGGLYGCEKSTTLREYTELNYFDIPMTSESVSRPMLTEQQSLTMAQDNLFKGQIPDDDIHRNLLDPQNTSMGGSPELNAQLAASADKTPMNWTTPAGWTEIKGSGMRLVTFKSEPGIDQVETSIITLGGSAGSTQANITRWMGQIGIAIPDPTKLQQFIAQQESLTTDAGAAAVIYDFTELQENTEKNAQSMIAGIIEKPNGQTFIKMTGTKTGVIQNRKKLQKLIQSLNEK